jgi:hypothetical protein
MSVACGGRAPLPTGDTTGTGLHAAAGVTGQGGSPSTASGVAGATSSGVAGGPGTGAGGTGKVGTGTAGANGTGGAVGTPCGDGALGGAGVVSTGAGGMCTNSPATADPVTCRCIPGAYTYEGSCRCQMGEPDICPVVGCTDKTLDPENCGCCGTGCGTTSTCNAGVCGPAPTMLLPAVRGCVGMTIAASGGTVYYADSLHNTINKIGAVAPLASNEMGATWLVLNGTNLFWYDAGSKKIRMMPTAGGAASDVYTNTSGSSIGAGMPQIDGFLVTPDGASIYVSLGTQVIKAPVAGGPSVVVANEVRGGVPTALALNGTTNIVYPATISGDVDAPLLGAMPAICGMQDANGNVVMTGCPRLGRSQGELLSTFIAALDGRAYWVDGSNLKGELIPTTPGGMGGTFDDVAMAQTSNVLTAVSNGMDTIYFGDADPGDLTHGYIEKTSIMPNSTPILLARAQNAPQSMALDAAKVYWATADCAIMGQDR